MRRWRAGRIRRKARGPGKLLIRLYVRRARHKHEVGIFDGGRGLSASGGGRVDNNEVATGFLGLAQELRQVDLGRKPHNGQGVLAPLGPLGGRLLRVHVQHEDIEAGFCAGNAKGLRERRFSDAALLHGDS